MSLEPGACHASPILAVGAITMALFSPMFTDASVCQSWVDTGTELVMRRLGGRDSVADGPAPWDFPDDPENGLVPLGIADAVLSLVTVDDVHTLLQSCPPKPRRALLRQVGLQDAKKVSSRTAETVLRTLQSGESQRRRALRYMISQTIVRAFGNADDLTADDCCALLDPETSATVLDRAPVLRRSLCREWPTSITCWCLALAVELSRPLAPVALGILVAEPVGPDSGADMVAAAWETLRAEHPELPERPIGISALQELARRHAVVPAAHNEEIETSMPSETSGETTPETFAGQSGDLGEAAAALENLREGLPAAADAADQVAVDLRAGRRPKDSDIALINTVIADFNALLTQVEAVAPGTSEDDLTALSTVLETVRRIEERADGIRALARVQGPDIATGLLEEVRRMARSGTGDGLHALAELIEVTTGQGDLTRATELAEQAREELPERFRRLVDLGLMGSLTILPAGYEGAGTGDTAADDDQTDVALAAERSADEPVSGDVMEPDPLPEEEKANEPKSGEDGSPPGDLADLDAMIATAFPARRLDTAASRADSVAPADDSTHDDAAAETSASEAEKSPEAVRQIAEQSGPEPSTSGRDETEPRSEKAALPIFASDLADAEAAALRAGRLGLAGWLRRAAGRPPAEESVRRCAAIAAEMARFAGPLSAEFAAAARDVNAETLADDRAGRILGWGAAIRATLVCPTPESTRLLEDLMVVVSHFPVLNECGEVFARSARGGAYLGSGVAGQVRGTAESTTIRQQASREATRQLEEEPHRKIKYQLATEVWKALLQQDGPIKNLLTIASQDNSALVDQAAAEVTRLGSGGEIDRLIDETVSRIGARRRTKKIIAGARSQLVTKVGRAIDTAGDWVRAVKDGENQEAAEAQDWRLGLLGQLQDFTTAHRSDVIAAFGEMASSSADVQAAAEVTRDLLLETFDLLNGKPVPETEPTIAQVLNRDLLLAPEVALRPNSLEPIEPPTVDLLIPISFTDDRAWRTAFKQRAERGDHEGTLGIIAVLERSDPTIAAELREQRDELIPQARDLVKARIDEIRDLVATWARDGALTESEVRRADETLNPLTDDRRDFDRIGRALDELRTRLEDSRETAMRRERDRLDERARADSRVAAVRDRIAERIEHGDLITSRDYLAQVEADKQLPEPSKEVDHLRRFFPAFPRKFADDGDRAGNRARTQETGEFVAVLRNALRAGIDVESRDLAALLSDTGIHIPALRNARRAEASEGLRQWSTCGRGPKAAGNLRTTITKILRMIGLEAAQHDASGTSADADRIWIDLTQVQVVGEPLLPAFGSRISPSGERLRLLLVWRRPGPQQLIEFLKGQPEDQTVMVWYFGVLSPEERQEMAAAARRRPAPVAGVLDDAAIGYLACMPEADWATAVALMAPFTATNPYAPTGDVPDEMFYGRDDQLREVTDRAGSSFVYGGRQLGKSALLRKAERKIRATDPARTVILENIQTIGKATPPERLWSRLAGRLAQAGVIRSGLTRREQVCEAVREAALNQPQRQVLILLDEADHFLNQDAKDAKYENVIHLRDLMSGTEGRVKVVFAGLHQTARFDSLTNQPFAHLGKPIAVGPLEPRDAFDLLVKPLATLGFTFPETLAARAIAEANNAPALVQLFAEELLKRLRRSSHVTGRFPYEITRDDVMEVWRDKNLARGFRDRFEWTLNLDKRYKVIAYTVALHALEDEAEATLGVGELSQQCRYWWAPGFDDCSSDDFRSLLDECVNLGVLGLDTDGYRLRTPHILNLLGGTAGVEEVLQNAGEFERPDSFDAHSYRAVFRDGPERSPLSSRQLTALLRPHDLVHVVAGSPALHAERVAVALQQEAEVPGVKVHLVRPGQITFDGAIDRADRHDGHTVIVVNVAEGKSEQQFARRLDEACTAIASPRPGTLAVILVTGVHLANVWRDLQSRDDVDLVELRRFGPAAIRQWMLEDSYGFPDEAGQKALLAATGGWPTLVGQVVNQLTGNGDDRERALERCREQLSGNPREFVSTTGVLADDCLAAAWRALVGEDKPETPEDLADLLDLYGEESTPALSERNLKEHGYSGTSDLVEALRLLGALEPREGRLICEPVLAEATRRMSGR